MITNRRSCAYRDTLVSIVTNTFGDLLKSLDVDSTQTRLSKESQRIQAILDDVAIDFADEVES